MTSTFSTPLYIREYLYGLSSLSGVDAISTLKCDPSCQDAVQNSVGTS
jgi:hypothetical protein